MRRRGARPRIALIAGGFILVLIALAIAMSVNSYRTPPAAPPAALDRIAKKNRDAATRAAARQRQEAAATSNAVDSLIENGTTPGANAL